jgi:hypothetical protein
MESARGNLTTCHTIEIALRDTPLALSQHLEPYPIPEGRATDVWLGERRSTGVELRVALEMDCQDSILPYDSLKFKPSPLIISATLL